MILVVIIIFFSLSFKSKQTPTNTMISFQDTKITSQLGIVITETHVACGQRERKIRELIEDCATLKEIMCTGKNSCETLNETLKTILNITIGQDLDYILTIARQEQQPITNFTTQGCQNTRRRTEAYTTPIGSTFGPITLMIRICY